MHAPVIAHVLRDDQHPFLVGVVLRRLDLHAVGDDGLQDLLQNRKQRCLQISIDAGKVLRVSLLEGRVMLHEELRLLAAGRLCGAIHPIHVATGTEGILPGAGRKVSGSLGGQPVLHGVEARPQRLFRGRVPFQVGRGGCLALRRLRPGGVLPPLQQR